MVHAIQISEVAVISPVVLVAFMIVVVNFTVNPSCCLQDMRPRFKLQVAPRDLSQVAVG